MQINPAHVFTALMTSSQFRTFSNRLNQKKHSAFEWSFDVEELPKSPIIDPEERSKLKEKYPKLFDKNGDLIFYDFSLVKLTQRSELPNLIVKVYRRLK